MITRTLYERQCGINPLNLHKSIKICHSWRSAREMFTDFSLQTSCACSEGYAGDGQNCKMIDICRVVRLSWSESFAFVWFVRFRNRYWFLQTFLLDNVWIKYAAKLNLEDGCSCRCHECNWTAMWCVVRKTGIVTGTPGVTWRARALVAAPVWRVTWETVWPAEAPCGRWGALRPPDSFHSIRSFAFHWLFTPRRNSSPGSYETFTSAWW